MKKATGIFLVLLILGSGMHISLAVHFCGGMNAGAKISFSGKTASCGMTEKENGVGISVLFKKHCCENVVRSLVVNPHYVQVAKMILTDPVQKLLQVFIVPVSISSNGFYKTEVSAGSVRPPGWNYCTGVENPVICVFRI